MTASRRAMAWSLAYLAVVAICIVPIVLKAGKFVGIYAMVATLPWSIIFFAALLVAEIWLRVTLFDNYAIAIGGLVIGASINAALIYRIVLNRSKVHV